MRSSLRAGPRGRLFLFARVWHQADYRIFPFTPATLGGMRSFIAAVFLLSSMHALAASRKGTPRMPDPRLTPGVAGTCTLKQICETKWGKDARHVSAAMKLEVYRRYGLKPDSGYCMPRPHKTKSGKIVMKGCEIDHLIGRELCGADDVENLWPQPYTEIPGAYQKDSLENYLNRQVCAHAITPEEAQTRIRTNWFAAYQEMEKKKPPRRH